MTTPERPEAEPGSAREPTSSEEPPDDDESEEALAARGRKLTWRLLFRLMISPMAFLAPCFSCGAAVTLAHQFGPVGGAVGALLGFALGVGAIFLWYFVIVGDDRGREEAFADKLIDDAEAGRLNSRLGRPKVAPIDIEPIALPSAPPLAIDIKGDLGSAVARIDMHENALEALAAAEALGADNGRDARAVACLSRTLLRAGRPKEGLRVAAEALHIAVITDQMSVVSRLVNAYWDLREDLALEAAVAETIADHLDAEGQANRAAFFRSGRTSLV